MKGNHVPLRGAGEGKMKRYIIFALMVFIAAGTQFSFATIDPSYSVTFYDATTNLNTGDDGSPYWWISGGADDYNLDLYERPTAQTLEKVGVKYVAREYFENLDIVQVQAGYDAEYMYIGMEMVGLNKLNGSPEPEVEGLVYRYQVRLGNNATPNRAPAGGLLLEVDQPSGKSNPTDFNGDKAFIYWDENGDVSGPIGVNTPAEKGGDGYETKYDSNGNLLTRTNGNMVEFAFNYTAYGYTETDLLNLLYLAFSTDKGMNGSSKFLWNDQYTLTEAGTPYDTNAQNIYEVDSLAGGPIPEPATLALLGLGALLLRRKK
jgi:hypothetical protein